MYVPSLCNALASSHIMIQLIYPTNNTPIGGGEADNIEFPTQTRTDWTFFIDIQYSTSADPQGLVLADLISKCGSNKKNLNVNYKITVSTTSVPCAPRCAPVLSPVIV